MLSDKNGQLKAWWVHSRVNSFVFFCCQHPRGLWGVCGLSHGRVQLCGVEGQVTGFWLRNDW